MTPTRWHTAVPGGMTHAYDATPDLIDAERAVASVCGHATALAADLDAEPDRVGPGEGCSWCRRALGMERRRGMGR